MSFFALSALLYLEHEQVDLYFFGWQFGNVIWMEAGVDVLLQDVIYPFIGGRTLLTSIQKMIESPLL